MSIHNTKDVLEDAEVRDTNSTRDRFGKKHEIVRKDTHEI